jgi:hypothetical protein
LLEPYLVAARLGRAPVAVQVIDHLSGLLGHADELGHTLDVQVLSVLGRRRVADGLRVLK